MGLFIFYDNVLKNAKKILLAIPKNIDFDTYISLQLLADVIKHELQTEVEIASEEPLPAQYTSIFKLPEVKSHQKLPQKSFVLEFPSQDSKVENVQWNQAEDKLTLFLTMQQGNLEPKNFDIKVAGSNYDLIMILGASKTQDLGSVYSQSQNIFAETKIVAFSLNPQFEEKSIKVIAGEKMSSMSEIVFTYLESNGIKIDADRANRVLTGIFYKTQNFKKNIKTAFTYDTASRLTKLGAQNEVASSAIANAISNQTQDDKSAKKENTQPSPFRSAPMQSPTETKQQSEPISKSNNDIAQQTSSRNDSNQTKN